MEIEIVDTPRPFRLHGLASPVENERYGEVGMKLMDAMWKVIKQSGAATTGINHWVYLPDGRMFVGAELLPNVVAPAELEAFPFELRRYLRHVHVGAYEALPAKWKALKDVLTDRGETIASPSLEIYGHHCGDSAKQETTILIGLQPRQ